MKKRGLEVVLVAGLLSLTGLSGAFGQNPPPAAPAAPAAGGLQILDFKPGLDDMMTMMVQPRHIKLFYAAAAKNWDLAAFQLDELRASFRRIGQTLPIYRTQDLNNAVAGVTTPMLDRVAKAITAKDAALFTKEYEALTDSCNACHGMMEHSFLIMKVPDASDSSRFPDQDFRPTAAP